MSVSSKRERRLSSLYSLIRVNTQDGGLNTSMIKAIDAGMTVVENYFDKILRETFFYTAEDYGIKMIRDLLGLSQINDKNVEQGFSQGFVDYKYGEFEEESQNAFKEILELRISNFTLYITGTTVTILPLVLYNIPFFEKYLCPGVVPRANEGVCDFDALDEFNLYADDWDEIAKLSFNFIDSIGGIE